MVDQRIAGAFESAMGISSIERTTAVTNLSEWDSLAHINLVLALEQEFGVSFTPEEAGEMLDVEMIERALEAKGALATGSDGS
jgi:acyl carrier protein